MTLVVPHRSTWRQINTLLLPSFDSLQAIASTTASTVSEVYLRQDVYQATWERFVRYRPRTRAGAWLMAWSARDDLLRREGHFQRCKSLVDDLPPDPIKGLMAGLELERLAHLRPKAFWRLLRLLKPGKSARMRHYYRQQLRECLEE